jgi:DNA-directed RNA polymerase specialized sigma24 family protein
MKIWELSEEAFLQLLARLNADPAQAGEAYEKLRAGLVFYFERKGCLIPADLADEAVNRVARKIEEGKEIEDVYKFSYGVARYVIMEYWNDPKREWEQLNERMQSSENEKEMDELRLECMKKCLQDLSPDERDLITKNCTMNKKEKLELALALGLTINALRLRVFRIRARLHECRENCVKGL